MNGTSLQPWSVVDEPDELLPQSDGQDASASSGAGADNGPSRAPTSGIRVGPRGAFLPIVAGLILHGWTLLHGIPARAAMGVTASQLGLCLLAGWLLWRGLVAQRSQMTELLAAARRQVTQRGGNEEVQPRLSPDLRAFQASLMEHLRGLSDGVQRSRDEGLSLGYRLASTEQRHTRAVLEGLSDAVLVFDATERLVYANPAAAAFTNSDFEQAHKRLLDELITHPGLAQQLRQAQRAPLRSRRHIEMTMAERNYDLLCSRLPEDDGRAVPGGDGEASGFVVAVLRDVTREREASKVMSEFVSHVSHELRTPLSSLKAYVEMLMTGEAEDEQTRKEYCGIIDAETDRMSRLIDEILNISRIESGVVKVSKEPVSLSLVVREVVEVMKPQAEKKQIKLVDEVSPVAHAVLADRDMIKQAILNLTSNAIKYTPDGGRVRVVMSVHEGQRNLVVEVSDTGLGIPEQDLPRVFEKFFRVKANAKIAKGTGLGLNLVKNIVETVHGGKVAVLSKVGQGSTFSITLPLV